MDWDDLRFFLAVARTGSLAGAARRLSVNHSTVSRRLKALETELGVRLFDRYEGSHEPTEAGAAMLEHALRVEAEMADMSRAVGGRDARLCGSLRLSTVDPPLVQIFAEELAAFVARYPGIDLEIANQTETVNLTRREADVALRLTNAPPEHLFGRRIGRLEFALYGPRTIVGELPGETSLESYPWLGWDERAGARLTEQWMKRNVPNARIACTFDSISVLAALMRAGVGLGFLPCVIADAMQELRRLRPVEPGFGMDLWILTHPDLRQTARVRALLESLGDAAERKRDALEGRLSARATSARRRTSRVFSGWRRRPYRSNRFGSTACRRRASPSRLRLAQYTALPLAAASSEACAESEADLQVGRGVGERVLGEEIELPARSELVREAQVDLRHVGPAGEGDCPEGLHEERERGVAQRRCPGDVDHVESAGVPPFGVPGDVTAGIQQ